MSDLGRARSLLGAAKRAIAFTGAGVSAESGVPVFRGAAGLWKQFRPEELATPQAFARDPELVWEWYEWRRGLVRGCQPNAAHRALAEWTRRGGATLITQNVDDLHERSGATDIVKLHGSLFLDRCSSCAHSAPCSPAPLSSPPRCPDCGALLRPGVVWFGEMLPVDQMERAAAAASEAEACLVVGTSGAVYPAAGIVHAARASGAAIVVVDPGETAFDGIADVKLPGAAAEIVPALLA